MVHDHSLPIQRSISSRTVTRLEVIIDEPLKATRGEKEKFVLDATTEFLHRLTPIVKSKPELWRGWAWYIPLGEAADRMNLVGKISKA